MRGRRWAVLHEKRESTMELGREMIFTLRRIKEDSKVPSTRSAGEVRHNAQHMCTPASCHKTKLLLLLVSASRLQNAKSFVRRL